MSKLHIANTFVEWELETDPEIALEKAFHLHPVYLQLQFLPLLYANADDCLLVTDLPAEETLNIPEIAPPQLSLLSGKIDCSHGEIEAWGPSRLIAKWAQDHHCRYHLPDWSVAKKVNSKQFSFENSPRLPHAALLFGRDEARAWLRSFPGKKVLKTCYGVSGRGHLHLEGEGMLMGRALSYLEKEWEKCRPVIAEPWVERVLDFSTQWFIETNGSMQFLGATVCANEPKGTYLSNRAGDPKKLFGPHLGFVEEHTAIAKSCAEYMARLGFFGNIGFDAMLYTHAGNVHLHPIVEINARKTMGWAALQFRQRHFPHATVQFSYHQCRKGALPSSLKMANGRTVAFPRNLTIDICN